ncbi:peptidyl-prolyl cis-trans isomerase G [Ixodes scapularis]|uniref:peptidyl-prolyl cis-trans isomerase G n=1 Tax=Ixodes scapularis TaxID=6945 RepID=UPI001A9E65AC|nr:peptidyl-prolyl cis-trans isomerase G [Ixodes scapularis]
MTIEKKYNPRCFFDVEIGEQPAGRVVFELFANVCPITCENFRSLCTGECGIGKTTGKPLHYKGVKFHRVIKSFMIQGGDFSVGNGSGGESIYGGTFKDECFDMKHDRPYLLSMANRGKDTNGSQFFITTQQTPHLDGVHVVFGQVIKGEEVVREVENQPTDDNSCPLQPVVIANCGELVLKRKQKDKRHKKTASSAASSDAESSSPEKAGEKRHKKRHKHHSKKSKREKHKRKEDSPAKEAQDDDGDVFIIKPDEIPEIPANNFLMRRVPAEADSNFGAPDRRMGGFYNRRPKISRSGRKIKGRGFMRYRTPSPEGGRSGSETPPHWKQAQSRMKPLKEYLDLAGDGEDEPMQGEPGDAQPSDATRKEAGKPRSSENTERRRDRKDRERDRSRDRHRENRDHERDRHRDRDNRNRDRETARTSSRNHQDENHPPAEPRRRRKFEENPRPRKGDREASPEGPRDRSPRRSKERPGERAARRRGSGEGAPPEERAAGEARNRAAAGARRHDREAPRDGQRRSPAKKVQTAPQGEQASHQRGKEGASSSVALAASESNGREDKAERRSAAAPTAAPAAAKAPRRFEEHPRSGEAEAAVPGVLRTRLPMTQLLDPAEPLPPGVEPDEITSCLDTASSLPSSQMKWGMSSGAGGSGGAKVLTSHVSSAEPKHRRASSPPTKAPPSRRAEAQNSTPSQPDSGKSLAQKPTNDATPAPSRTSAPKTAERRKSSSKSSPTIAPSNDRPKGKAAEGSSSKAARESKRVASKVSRSRSRSQSRGRRGNRKRSSSPPGRKRNRSASSSSGGGRRKARGRGDSSDEDRSRGAKGHRGRRSRRRSSSSSSASFSSSSASSSSGDRGRRKRRKGNASRSGRRKRSSSSSSSSSD